MLYVPGLVYKKVQKLIQSKAIFLVQIFANSSEKNLVDSQKKKNPKCLYFYEKLLNYQLLTLDFTF